MENEKLNRIVINYRRYKDEDVFNQIYEELLGDLSKKGFTIARSMGATVEDVYDIYHDTLLKCIEQYGEVNDFRHYFLSSVRRERAYFIRGEKNRRLREVVFSGLITDDETSEEDRFETKVASEYSLEEEFLASKRADQVALIDSLVSEADELTTAIVKTSLTYIPKKTAGRPMKLKWYVASQLGIDRRTVERKFESLAGKFDSKQYGDYSDYLVAL